ncbi:hypothetical protein FRC98_05880 [Lujinxingia vulgaris]|uniref:DUF1795 domain-containing protein n=1 Tax=Lujinxingia vulgaris TaxID=2600176 RepID=A0A5C6XAR8_9DELT|nr:hypothetical protein [Lujinxingia vulgaris]TXD38416.1 hypothetical protein FRC98_05880 [Lujinxingia vulgaris]
MSAPSPAQAQTAGPQRGEPLLSEADAEVQRADDGLPPTASGRVEPEAVEARAEAVTLEEIGARIRRPTGWIIVPSGRGAVATFRATSDSEAQIEVRLSGEILVGRAERYAQSFQNQIQGAGFRVETAERDVDFGGRTGDLLTYGVDADGESYRLMTWLHHSEEQMWVFSLFCVEGRLEAYREVFEELIVAMTWSDGEGAE